MKNILVLGAGLSASSMIRYLLQHAIEENWMIHVVDLDLKLVNQKLNGHERGIAYTFNALNRIERIPYLQKSDLVISMLPARFHHEVAQDCLALKKNLITPSYVSPDMAQLNQEAKNAGLLFMNEIGVDPGIDHMSAMRIIDDIKAKGGRIHAFKSYCGGLIAPESDTNPWNYKFTWNPRNVVVAGQGGAAKYIEQKAYKYISYPELFQRLDTLKIDGYGTFEGYANRDSLSYRKIYGLDDIPTMYRGTLRRPGFCLHWNVFVELGMTDDSYKMENSEELTPADFLAAFLPNKNETTTLKTHFEEWLAHYHNLTIERFEWLGLLDNTEAIGIPHATPAQLLEALLVKKWKLEENDKDMLVMVHEFEVELNSKKQRIHSSMVSIGEDQIYTAMSNTVGLPIAICAKLMLQGKIKLTGVQVPTDKSLYEPILNELEDLGIQFNESIEEV